MATFHFFETLTSTIDEAHSRVLQGAEEGTVIITAQQTQGRGRRGHVWETLPGNLHMTYITYLECPLLEALQLSFVACVAVGENLRRFLSPHHSLTYKWPNDVLLNRKKIGGLSVEVVPLPKRKETAYLISCGLNVASQPLNARYPASSLQEEGVYLSLQEVLEGITISLENYMNHWKKTGFSAISDLWMKNAVGLNQKISFDLEGRLQEGFFKGIDGQGALLLRTTEGLKKFTVGEILVGEQNAVSH
jgi:BirA family biotin operon repressor/biotin-[acetyl-CoA-carboxylase] ligase